jgi:phosphate transport system protein
MLKTYEEKRKLIQDDIVSIGNDVIDALEESLKALKKEELSLLKDVDLPVKKISHKSNEIDNKIVTVLALYSPEAKDLRQLVSYLKITNELVRASANTKTFTKMFRKAYSEDLNTKTILEYAIPLQKSTILALQTSVNMLTETNPTHIEEKYQRVIIEESKTNDLYAMIEKNILKLIHKNLDLSKEYFDILSSLRKIERTADRAASIANLLLFAQIGGEMEQS